MSLKIKICGMLHPENIAGVSALQPDMMGFVFYRDSPRFAGDMADAEVIRSLPDPIIKTGVFVNENPDILMAMAERYNLNAVQLHGDETPGFCKLIRKSGLLVIKTFGIKEKEDFIDCQEYTGCTDFFIFDTRSVSFGGSGRQFDWDLLKDYNLDHPFMLSGGIGADDAEKIFSLQNRHIYGVDLNSRFEHSPGIKNIPELEKFIQKIRQYNR